MRAGSPVIIAMVLVVTSFAASLAYSQYLVRQIDESARSIIEESVPRFEHIHEARRALVTLEDATLAEEQLARAGPEPLDTRAEIFAALELIRTELAAYQIESPQEAAQIAATQQDVENLEDGTRRALAQMNTGDRVAALAELDQHARPLEVRISRTFERLRHASEQRVMSDTRHIISLRRSAVQAATALGLLSIALAVAATVLVVHAQHVRARLVAEHQQLMAERAAELESFAGRVAHDLRDPLSAAGSRLSVLERSCDLDASARGQLGKVRVQLGRMRGVIDGLLEFARSGARPAAGAQASLPVVLDEVLTSVGPQAEAAHTELRIGPLTDATLAVAPEALSSVLANLLGNAVKYVGEGQQLPHRVAVRASRRAGLARIEVEDNGPGLPAGAEDRVFEPFRRLPSQQPGSGLGLATVKRIVEAYHGRVGVVAEPGRGSTFWVEIPCSDPQPAVREPVHEG